MPSDLPRSARVTQSPRFKTILALKASATDEHLTIFAGPNPGHRPRLGLVVGRRHGNAVVRNRKKRLLRAAFRLVQSELPAKFDYVLMPRTTPAATLEDYVRSLRQLAPRAAARAARHPA